MNFPARIGLSLKLNGFDQAAGAGLEFTNLKLFAETWSKRSKANLHDSVLEVGCGSGAFLALLNSVLESKITTGYDFSETLTKFGKTLFPNLNFFCEEAAEIDVNLRSDHVTSFSVFQYFPDYEYCGDVVSRMCQIANKTVSILDVPNLRHKNESESFRASINTNLESTSDSPVHLYYDPEFLAKLFDSRNWEVVYYQQDIPNYLNSKFRFNLFANRK